MSVRNTRGEASDKQLWTPLFTCITVITFCSFFAAQGLNSGTSVFLERLGEPVTLAGGLAAAASVASAVTRLISGPLVDKTGRILVMAAGLACLLVGTLAMTLASSSFAYVLCRIVQGAGFAAATTAAATAAADVLPKTRLGEGIGYYGLGQALAMAMGPMAAILLAATNPPQNLYLGIGLVVAVGLALTAFCSYEKNPDKVLPPSSAYRERWTKLNRPDFSYNNPSARNAASQHAPKRTRTGGDAVRISLPKRIATALNALFERKALPGTAPMLLLAPVFGFAIFFVGLYGSSLGVAQPGLFYTTSAIAMIAVRIGSARFMDSAPPTRILGCAATCGVLSFGMLIFADGSDLLFYASGLPYGICLGAATPICQAVTVKNTPPERWGGANALFLLVVDLGAGLGATLWGFTCQAIGFQATLACVMACAGGSYLIARFCFPHTGHSKV